MLLEIIAENLKKYRKIHNLSQQNIANLLGVHINVYARYERNETQITIETIEKMATLINVDPSWLFSPHSLQEIEDLKHTIFRLPHNNQKIKKISLLEDSISSSSSAIMPSTGAGNITNIAERINVMEQREGRLEEMMAKLIEAQTRGAETQMETQMEIQKLITESARRQEEIFTALLKIKEDENKQIEQITKFTEINYLFEVGEISAEEAKSRMNIKKIKRKN